MSIVSFCKFKGQSTRHWLFNLAEKGIAATLIKIRHTLGRRSEVLPFHCKWTISLHHILQVDPCFALPLFSRYIYIVLSNSVSRVYSSVLNLRHPLEVCCRCINHLSQGWDLAITPLLIGCCAAEIGTTSPLLMSSHAEAHIANTYNLGHDHKLPKLRTSDFQLLVVWAGKRQLATLLYTSFWYRLLSKHKPMDACLPSTSSDQWMWLCYWLKIVLTGKSSMTCTYMLDSWQKKPKVTNNIIRNVTI